MIYCKVTCEFVVFGPLTYVVSMVAESRRKRFTCVTDVKKLCFLQVAAYIRPVVLQFPPVIICLVIFACRLEILVSVFIRGHSLQFPHGNVDFTGFSGGKISLLTKKFSRFFFLRNTTDYISVKISAVVG